MKFSCDDFISNSFVIARDKSEYDLFLARFKNEGFNHEPKFFEGRLPECFFMGDKQAGRFSAIGHYYIVCMARSMNLDHVTVFESDAMPTIRCKEKMDKFLDNGVPDDAHLITFGNLYWIKDCLNGKHNLCEITSDGRFGRIRKTLWGSHAVTYFKEGYDSWIDNYRRLDRRLNADFFRELSKSAYSTTRSFFVQATKDNNLQYDRIIDKNNLSEFRIV